MGSENELKESSGDRVDRELQLLSAVAEDPEVTQRSLSLRLGIALGLTNLVLHNLAEKGYIRITQAGWRRWIYTVTPSGFSRKVHLTMAYVHRFLNDYQRVRQMIKDEIEPLALNEESRIAVCGTGEFAELVYLALREIGIADVDFFCADTTGADRFLGSTVRDVTMLNPSRYDRILVADSKEWEPAIAVMTAGTFADGMILAIFTKHHLVEEK